MTEQEPGSTATERDARLAQRFVSLADTLVDDFDLVELLDRLVQTCVDLLDVTTAGLLIVDQNGILQPVAASTEATRILELFQLQNDEGPCLDCVRTGEPVTVPDVAAVHDRWPRFARAVAESGFVSMHALPMRLRRQTIGSLNLFSESSPGLRRTTSGSPRRSPMWPRSGSSSNARCTGPPSSRSSSRARWTRGS